MTDPRTIAVYDARADDYAAAFAQDRPDAALAAFIARLPPGGAVLDLGCGTGRAAAAMRDAGLAVEAWDASAGMAAHARREHGLTVRVAGFDALDAVAAFDGVWANFSLLHAPAAAFPGHLAAVRRALRPGGALHLGMKLGAGEARDRLGRAYAYYSEAALRDHLAAAGFTVGDARRGEEAGLAGTVEPWITLSATAA